MKLPVTSCRLQVTRRIPAVRRTCNLHLPTCNRLRAFSLVELLVVMTLLTLIVLALMQVFSTTQRAFRASVTQTDVMEGGRAAVDLISSDLRQMTPSYGYSNGPINFFVLDNSAALTALAYQPLAQNLPGAGVGVQRANVLDYFFVLGRENTRWVGIGYVVDAQNQTNLYPLYRYYAETNVYFSPLTLYNNFIDAIKFNRWTNMSHVIDGVVHLVVRPADLNGYPMTNTYQFLGASVITNRNIAFYPQFNYSYGAYFFSNAIPAAVELEFAKLEDRALKRAESLPNNLPAAPPNDRRSLYLLEQSGSVHVFRQHIAIPNVDHAAYQ